MFNKHKANIGDEKDSNALYKYRVIKLTGQHLKG